MYVFATQISLNIMDINDINEMFEIIVEDDQPQDISVKDLAYLIVSLRYTFQLNGNVVLYILEMFRDIHAKIEAKSNDQLTYEKAAKNVREYDHVIGYIAEGNECVSNGYFHGEIVDILNGVTHQQLDALHEVPLVEVDHSYYDSPDASRVPMSDISTMTPPLQNQTARFESCDNENSVVRHLTF